MVKELKELEENFGEVLVPLKEDLISSLEEARANDGCVLTDAHVCSQIWLYHVWPGATSIVYLADSSNSAIVYFGPDMDLFREIMGEHIVTRGNVE